MNQTGGTHGGTARGLAALAVAMLVVLAGCGAGVPSGAGDATEPDTDAGAASETTTGTATESGAGAGTVNFYISDQRNAIDQFEHLNVTVTAVTLVRAGGEDDGDYAEDTENGTASPTATATSTATPTESANGTATPTDAGNATSTSADEATEVDAESDEKEDAAGGRVTYQVDNVTVDLTELQGPNATRLGTLEAPNGTYTQVVVAVAAVNGTLTDGTTAAVKLPSGRLKLNKPFTLGDGEAVDFVFDITVFERGPNGYILRPVAGESGTGDEVEIRDVGRGNRTAAGAGGNGSGGDGTGGNGNGNGGNGNESGGNGNGADERNAVEL